jgi:hypothetical protein
VDYVEVRAIDPMIRKKWIDPLGYIEGCMPMSEEEKGENDEEMDAEQHEFEAVQAEQIAKITGFAGKIVENEYPPRSPA